MSPIKVHKTDFTFCPKLEVIDVRRVNPESIPQELSQLYTKRVVMKKVDLCDAEEVRGFKVRNKLERFIGAI
jgi:hypothetical protein